MNNERFMQHHYGASGYVKKESLPRYFKFLEKGPPEHATPIFGITCDEGWRESVVCTGMYEWAADWLVEQLQGKPYAPGKH